MTHDEIIKLAREAGFSAKHAEVYFDRQLKRFAALVAQHEREACAKVCDALAERSPFLESFPIAAAAIRTRRVNP